MNNKNHVLINLKKAKSLIEKIIKMVENGEYCIDIMQQNLAVVGLLKSSHKLLMERHLKTCFKKAMETKNNRKKDQMIKEILTVTNLVNK